MRPHIAISPPAARSSALWWQKRSRPCASTRLEGEDGLARLNILIDKTYPRFRKYEPHMRAALQLALEHRSLEKAGLLEEEPFRRGQRREILKLATEPLKKKLSQPAYDRLLNALSVVYGIEPFIVLKDICGASERETEAVVRWMIEALVTTALRENRRVG